MSDEDLQERLSAAAGGAGRILSGARPVTLRERLARLSAEAETAYDLGEPVDHYGDGVVAALERRIAELLGTEAAAFFPTGTMAQQVALRCWAERTGSPLVAMHPLAHPEVHERHAYAQLSGLRTVWPTRERRQPTAEEVRGIAEPFGTLMLELPLRDAGFLLPTWEELVELAAAARERDAVVHLDGARLWESTVYLGQGLPEIAALADSVYVSFYKTLGGLSGAALAGPEVLIGQAKAWRHRYGGQLFEQWPAALSALAGLERELPRLGEYVAHARVVAEALAEATREVPGARVLPEPPHTHQFQFWLPWPPEVLLRAALRQAEEDGAVLFRSWRAADAPGVSFTEVTCAEAALGWSPEEITGAVRTLVAHAAAEAPGAAGA